MDYLQMTKLSDRPNYDVIPEDFWLLTKSEKQGIIHTVANAIVEQTADLTLSLKTFDTDTHTSTSTSTDHVLEYAQEVCSLGLLFMNYRDSIKEGDGDRLVNCWKFMLPIFKATDRRNYAIEAFNTLVNIKILPPRLAHQLVWSRFVNVHGIQGRNIPFDLQIEHMNRLVKDCVKHLGANKTGKAIIRFSKALGPVSKIISSFDSHHNSQSHSGLHKVSSIEKDRDSLIKELREKAHVFKYTPGRFHKSFPKFIKNPIKLLAQKTFYKWLEERAKENGLDLIIDMHV